MSDINTVILTGRIANDIETQTFEKSENIKATFSVANNQWSKKEEKEIGSFFNCEIWNKQAEYLIQYAKKGDAISLQGKLCKSNYTDKNGNKKSNTYIAVETFKLMTKKADTETTQTKARKKAEQTKFAEQEMGDEDIPF